MEAAVITAVGIDVSKSKSTVAVPLGDPEAKSYFGLSTTTRTVT